MSQNDIIARELPSKWELEILNSSKSGIQKVAMRITNVTGENFESVVSKSHFALLDFWADWCGPCRIMEPVIEKLAVKYGDKMVFGKVNVDQEMDISSRYQVFSIPTFMLFKNGKPMDGLIGAVGEASLDQMVRRALNGQKD